VLWAPLWLPAFGVMGVPQLPLCGNLGGLGPMLSAVFLIWVSKGSSGLNDLARRVVWPGRGLFWLVAFPMSALCIALGSASNMDGQWLSEGRLGAEFVLNLVFFGLGEEV